MPVTTYGSYSNLDNYIGCNKVSAADAAAQAKVQSGIDTMNATAANLTKIPQPKEGYEAINSPGQFYNNLQPYNGTGCHSYKVPDYKKITYDALTHGGKPLRYGHFNIMDAYGANAASCDIGTVENFVHRS
jgi:hypothetical protein